MAGDQLHSVPDELRPYYRALVAITQDVLGPALVAVYAVGSMALGDWIPATSDVDVAVIAQRPTEADLRRLAQRLDDAVLAVPARKLELVVYERARVANGEAAFALNFNTGRGTATTVELDPAPSPSFWFVIDLAIARAGGLALVGPPAEELIAAPVEIEVRAALRDGATWYLHHGGDPGATLLAACRAWHHLATGRWAGKSAAACWAAQRVAPDEPELAAAIVAAAGMRTAGKAGRIDVGAHAARMVDRVITAAR